MCSFFNIIMPFSRVCFNYNQIRLVLVALYNTLHFFIRVHTVNL